MKIFFTFAAVALMAGAVGCNRAGTVGSSAARTKTTTERTTTTTTPDPADRTADRRNGGGNVDVDLGRDRTTAPLTGPSNSGVNVDVRPGGGVDVDVQGEPVRDRIRERRAERNAAMPR